jgi:hypothetical protein
VICLVDQNQVKTKTSGAPCQSNCGRNRRNTIFVKIRVFLLWRRRRRFWFAGTCDSRRIVTDVLLRGVDPAGGRSDGHGAVAGKESVLVALLPVTVMVKELGSDHSTHIPVRSLYTELWSGGWNGDAGDGESAAEKERNRNDDDRSILPYTTRRQSHKCCQNIGACNTGSFQRKLLLMILEGV